MSTSAEHSRDELIQQIAVSNGSATTAESAAATAVVRAAVAEELRLRDRERPSDHDGWSRSQRSLRSSSLPSSWSGPHVR